MHYFYSCIYVKPELKHLLSMCACIIVVRANPITYRPYILSSSNIFFSSISNFNSQYGEISPATLEHGHENFRDSFRLETIMGLQKVFRHSNACGYVGNTKVWPLESAILHFVAHCNPIASCTFAVMRFISLAQSSSRRICK